MFANMKVAVRLALGFGVLIVLLLLQSMMTLQSMGNIFQDTLTITEDRYVKVRLALDGEQNAMEIGRNVRSILIASSDAEIEQLKLPPAFAAELHSVIAPGTTLVVAQEPLGAQSTGPQLTVLSAAGAGR